MKKINKALLVQVSQAIGDACALTVIRQQWLTIVCMSFCWLILKRIEDNENDSLFIEKLLSKLDLTIIVYLGLVWKINYRQRFRNDQNLRRKVANSILFTTKVFKEFQRNCVYVAEATSTTNPIRN